MVGGLGEVKKGHKSPVASATGSRRQSAKFVSDPNPQSIPWIPPPPALQYVIRNLIPSYRLIPSVNISTCNMSALAFFRLFIRFPSARINTVSISSALTPHLPNLALSFPFWSVALFVNPQSSQTEAFHLNSAVECSDRDDHASESYSVSLTFPLKKQKTTSGAYFLSYHACIVLSTTGEQSQCQCSVREKLLKS